MTLQRLCYFTIQSNVKTNNVKKSIYGTYTLTLPRPEHFVINYAWKFEKNTLMYVVPFKNNFRIFW